MALLCEQLGESADRVDIEAYHMAVSVEDSSGPTPLFGDLNAFVVMARKGLVMFMRVVPPSVIDDEGVLVAFGQMLHGDLVRAVAG
jgi:hypothetical protein